MNKYLAPTMAVLLILLTIFLSQIQPVHQNTTEVEVKQSIPNITPDNQDVKAEFNKIANTPYDEQDYNCLNKSRDFHNYLLLHGAANGNHTAYLKRIYYKDGSYAHAFVLWDGLVYDPTNTPPCYGVEYNKYINALKEVGFTGQVY